MYKVVCIGNNPSLVNSLKLIKDIRIEGAIVEKGKAQFLLAHLEDDIKPICVSNAEELDAVIEKIGDIDFAVMYDFGIRVGEKSVKKLSIYNFHPGDLRTNRGSSPVNWSILNADGLTKMTLYRISTDFDLGEVMVERNCKVYSMDVPSTLRMRLEGEIPSMMLELLWKLKHAVEGVTVASGVYRKRISEQDYTINVGDSIDVINAKIRSQYDYNGAVFFDGKNKMYVKNIDQIKDSI